MAKSEWFNLTEAWEQLGYSSYASLWAAARSGLFREGKELRDRRRPGSKRARWQIDIPAAQTRLNTPHDKRSAL